MSDRVLIDQRFRLGRIVRASQVAVVYEALHRNGRRVWIKLPRGREHAEALVNEGGFANALGTCAVRVEDDGRTEDGLPYLVMDPVTGQRLDHWRRSSGGRAPLDEVIGLADELCQAIETLHRVGFAVGLLRPDTIIVLPEGGICLLALEHAVASSPSSMAEDVARVGKVLYEMLSGRPCLAQPRPLHTVAPELPRVAARAIDAAVSARFPTIESFRDALRRAILGPIRAPIQSIPPDALTNQTSTPAIDDPQPDLAPPSVRDFERVKPEPPPRRPRLLPFIAGAGACAVFLGSIALAIFARGPDEEAKAPKTKAARTPPPAPIDPPSPPVTSAPVETPDVASSEVVEVDDLPSKLLATVSAAVEKTDARAGPPGEAEENDTAFRFEGDLSPRFVFVDGVVIGATNKPIRTRCGSHAVKIGAKGVSRQLDLPCAGETGIVIEPNGAWRER